MAITAKINSSTSAGPQRVSVTVPSTKISQSFKQLNDVNVTTLEDGALIQYDAASDKFITKNTIVTTTGTLKLSGGAY